MMSFLPALIIKIGIAISLYAYYSHMWFDDLWQLKRVKGQLKHIPKPKS